MGLVPPDCNDAIGARAARAIIVNDINAWIATNCAAKDSCGARSGEIQLCQVDLRRAILPARTTARSGRKS